MILHHIESLTLEPLHLIQPGILKIHSVSLYKGKCIKSDISLCRDLIVELPDGTAAQIPRILVFCVGISDLFIDLFKILIRDNGLSSQD